MQRPEWKGMRMSDRGKTETDNEREEIGRWRKVKHKAKYKMGRVGG